MNFPIKALPKGKDSCHANRQQSTFIAFFHGRVRKTRKSPIPAQHTQPKRTAQPPSQLTSHSTKLSSVQRPLQLAEVLHYYVMLTWPSAMRKSSGDIQTNQKSNHQSYVHWTERFHSPKFGEDSLFFLDSNSASMQCKPLGCRVQLHKDLNLRSWLN